MGHAGEIEKKIVPAGKAFLTTRRYEICLVGYEQNSYQMAPGFVFRMLLVRLQKPTTSGEINKY
jgi:hypothetical protein